MEREKRPMTPPPSAGPEGCLVTAIRLPVRIVVLVLVVPVRLIWDALVVSGRFLHRYLLRPLGRALFVVPWVWAYRNLLTPLGHGLRWCWHTLAVLPARWLYAHVLTPVGHLLALVTKAIGDVLGRLVLAVFVWPWVGLWRYVVVPVGRALAWLGRVLLVAPALWLYHRLLTPLGHGIAWAVRALGTGLAFLWRWLVVVPAVFLWRWLVVAPAVFVWRWLVVAPAVFVWRWLVVAPAVFLWRWVLVPVGRVLAVIGREVGAALGHAWRIAGYVSRAVGRFLGQLLRWVFVEPVRWTYRHVMTPVGHLVRDGLWRPVARTVRAALTVARDSARQVRADLRRALFGAPRPEPEPLAPATAHGEPGAAGARTLGSSTTAYTKLTKD
ncbi:hypothetical protein GUY60_03685 [Streptomyces sp. YC537]|uniref:Uncharacterized protein n=2 Tax=Streptomyces boluensis TaxID=1775135 RepID=A0A964UK22_9ACTN|nr:hypothetical protein [Streptomyces boluensis]